MSTEVLIRGFFATLISLSLAWAFYEREDPELRNDSQDAGRPRYGAMVSSGILPSFLLVLGIAVFLTYTPQNAARLMLSLCFGIFLHISIYYALLIPALPLLRKTFSARACAVLWLLPNFLYFINHSFMELPEPALILRIPADVENTVFVIWLIGFAAVLVWSVGSHFLYRRYLLWDSQKITDPDILSLWEQEQLDAGIKRPTYRLVASPNTATPLSIGFWKWSIRVVLPDAIYSQEELQLIFRHELVHICRGDSSTKFFLAFCTAMCWFNPLMWIAMKRSAEDLELSCDETVLLEAEEDTRWKYANLLLRTAGDDRGFTTCLAASAQSLRYRLKNVVSPGKRLTGGILVGLVFFLLIMSCGYVALAYEAGSGSQLIFQDQAPALFTIKNISFGSSEADSYGHAGQCSDELALNQYLASLSFSHMAGNYSFPTEGNFIILIYQSPKGAVGVKLTDQVLIVTPLYDQEQTSYYVDSQINWSRIFNLIEVKTAEELAPWPPQLELYFGGAETAVEIEPIFADAAVLAIRTNGVETQPEDEHHSGGPATVSGLPVTDVGLVFSHKPLYGYTVVLTAMETGETYTLTEADIENYVLYLDPISTSYTVRATFEKEPGVEVDMEYRFEVEFPKA